MMKNAFLLVPLCTLIFSCEKEQPDNAVAENSERAVLNTVERINPDNVNENSGGDREVAYSLTPCPMSEEEKEEGSLTYTGEQCINGDWDDCADNNNTRCKSQGTGVGPFISMYLTPEEANRFWGKNYTAEFVYQNWDFFMACYNAGELLHPDQIINRNF